MKISIITVCFNSVDTIRDTIDSVLSQDYPEIEYIIVDGASRDGTMAIVDTYKDKIATVISEPDTGMYDAMNKGIAVATGDIIGFLHADDVYVDETVITTVIDVLSAHDIDACYGDLLYVRREDLSQPVRYWKSGVYRPGSFSEGWMPAHPTFFCKTVVYQEFGGFDLSYPLAADVELLIRLIGKHSITTHYVPKLFVKMRLGGVSNQGLLVVIRQNIAIYRALKKNGMTFSCLFPVKKILKRLKQFYQGVTYGKA